MINDAERASARRFLALLMPALADPLVVKRFRQLRAASRRAARYHGTPRGRIWAWGIGRRQAQLVDYIVDRHGFGWQQVKTALDTLLVLAEVDDLQSDGPPA